MFHLLGYYVAAGVNAANTDMVASSADAVFSQRNNHYIFSERYQVLAWAHLAASATRARFNLPSLNAVGRHMTRVVNRAATPLSFPRVNVYTDYPIQLPVNEELAIEASNDLAAGTEDTTSFIWISTPQWTRNIPRGTDRLVVRFTATVARVADTWSGLGIITFADNLRSGWYTVVGAQVFSANLRAFRLFFPRSPFVGQRQLRPGSLTLAAVGDIASPLDGTPFGVWGHFNSFEPPQLEVWGDTAGADTQEGRLDVVYHGDQPPAALYPASPYPVS